MEKRWVSKNGYNITVVEQLAQEMGLSVALSTLMVQRGITNKKEAIKFFEPSLDDLHDPFLMKDMTKAVERLISAFDNNEKILVYGDYDVDGTTAVALVYSFLRERTQNVIYYVPDRYEEGYGISIRGLNYAADNNCKLVLTLDCGIKAVKNVEYANSLGLDIIICDHHYPGNTIPDAVAVLDPKQPGCTYPYKELSGCGVGFKLICAFAKIQGIAFETLIPYLDLLAVSIASDIVPITGENRVLAWYGIQQLNDNPRLGLREIIRELRISKRISVEDVIFKIGPRINAAGRMDTGERAVELLVATNHKVAATISKEINYYNSERRNYDRSITAEAMKMIADSFHNVNAKTTVLYNSGWKKGVIGIVASRLIETYYRPTVILTESNGMATGSARSVADYDLYQAIEACSDLLDSFGGHMYAAGLTLKKENITKFAEKFEQYVASTIKEDQLRPMVNIDIEVPFNEITVDFFEQISRFQPFGPENTTPVFMSRNIYAYNGSCSTVGSSREHLKFDAIQGGYTNNILSAIAFGQANHYEYLKSGRPIDICYSIEMNTFRNVSNLQLNIRDIKPHYED